jgi:hypothetical protein
MFGRKKKASLGAPAEAPEVENRVTDDAASGVSDAADAQASAVSDTAAAVSAVSDAEVVAVIAAALAAYQSEGVARDIVYRKINRTAGPRTEWNLAGLREVLASRDL